MKKIYNYLETLTYYKYLFLLIILGYLPIFIFGYFIQDDLGVVAGLSDLRFADAVRYICVANNNRPLSCIYHALLTRLPQVYQIYFLINLLFYIFFILNIIKVFDFILDDIFFQKIFTIFLIFPFFSYTILYSPAMQSMGTFALLLWSISLIFLRKFIHNDKKINIILSYIFLLLTYLIYESSFPLLAISFFFPLYFNNKIKLFFLNFFVILFILFIIILIQKFLIPKIYGVNLSRFKINFYDYKSFFFLIIINLTLTLNIIFQSFEIFLQIFLDFIDKPNYIFLLQVLLILLIFYIVILKKNFFKKNINKNKYIAKVSLLIFFSVIFLNCLMHTLAFTGLEFIKYNNRALVSLSFIFAFLIVFILKFITINSKFFFNFIFTFIFLVFIGNFFYFQNNLVKERFQATSLLKIMNIKTKNKKEVFFFIITQKTFVQDLLSYNSYDYVHHLNNNKINFLSGEKVVIYVTEQKICNKSYYDEYIRKSFINNYGINLFLFNKDINNLTMAYKNISFDTFENKIFSLIKCDYEMTKSVNFLKKNIYISDNFRSLFINFLHKFYQKL